MNNKFQINYFLILLMWSLHSAVLPAQKPLIIQELEYPVYDTLSAGWELRLYKFIQINIERYDSSGLKTETWTQYNGTKPPDKDHFEHTVFQYENGQLTDKITNGPKGNLVSKVQNYYDGSGQLIRIESSSENEKYFNFTIQNKYLDGHLVSSHMVDKIHGDRLTEILYADTVVVGHNVRDLSGKVVMHDSISFDKYGNQTRLRQWAADGKPSIDIRFRYTYDSLGNWITRFQQNQSWVRDASQPTINFYFKTRKTVCRNPKAPEMLHDDYLLGNWEDLFRGTQVSFYSNGHFISYRSSGAISDEGRYELNTEKQFLRFFEQNKSSDVLMPYIWDDQVLQLTLPEGEGKLNLVKN